MRQLLEIWKDEAGNEDELKNSQDRRASLPTPHTLVSVALFMAA
jgi:hypothetical protein